MPWVKQHTEPDQLTRRAYVLEALTANSADLALVKQQQEDLVLLAREFGISWSSIASAANESLYIAEKYRSRDPQRTRP